MNANNPGQDKDQVQTPTHSDTTPLPTTSMDKRKLVSQATINTGLKILLSVLVAATLSFYLIGKYNQPHTSLEEKRVEEIKTWLKKYNKYPSFTPPASDRKFWESIPNKPPKTKPIYDTNLLARIEEGVMQECAYGTGEWIKLIEENIEIALTCNLRLLEDKVDISLTTWSGALAYALAMVGDQLNPSLVLKTKAFLQREVITPFLHDTKESQNRVLKWEDDACAWLNTKTNWTSVCVGYIVYTALVIEDDINKLALIIARAEHEMHEHLKTFGTKGYIPSGMRYWNYGFRNFVLIAENLLHATGGNINLYANDIAPQVAMFPFSYRLKEKNPKNPKEFFPNFGDNSNPVTSEELVFDILSDRVNIPWEKKGKWGSGGRVQGPLHLASISTDKINYKSPAPFEDIDFWESGGVSISYSRDQEPMFAVATKGGHNDEDHNHNDLGSYIVFKKPNNNSDWKWISGDPENLRYLDGYFGTHRYQFPTTSSWGHPLPTVNNQLQIHGISYRADILHYEQDAQTTTLVFELKYAYQVTGLKNLIRIIQFEKVGPTLSILDYAHGQGFTEFSSPITTKEEPRVISQTPNTIILGIESDSINVLAYTPKELGLGLSTEEFSEDANKYVRTSFEVQSTKNNPWIFYQFNMEGSKNDPMTNINKRNKKDNFNNEDLQQKIKNMLQIVESHKNKE